MGAISLPGREGEVMLWTHSEKQDRREQWEKPETIEKAVNAVEDAIFNLSEVPNDRFEDFMKLFSSELYSRYCEED
jgi:hypothetical protein